MKTTIQDLKMIVERLENLDSLSFEKKVEAIKCLEKLIAEISLDQRRARYLINKQEKEN